MPKGRGFFARRPRELIGEHTDHNLGFVLPMAIDFSTWVAIAPRDDRRIVLRSENLAATQGV